MSKQSSGCTWPGTTPLYLAYHDEEWGVPEYDDKALFEKLILDGFQAGLSWITILKKRDNFRAAFDDFEPAKIARYKEAKILKLLQDEGIVRHRGKIEATIGNAKVWLDIMENENGFSNYLWDYVGGKPLQNRPGSMSDVPVSTDISAALSKDLKARGFKFCGPTIVYAFMQAVGMVNDHVDGCKRQKEVAKLARPSAK